METVKIPPLIGHLQINLPARKKSNGAGGCLMTDVPTSAEAVLATSVIPTAKKAKCVRKNWYAGEGLIEMSAAVAEWKELTMNGKQYSKTLFAEQRRIPKSTFHTHLALHDCNRIEVDRNTRPNLVQGNHQLH